MLVLKLRTGFSSSVLVAQVLKEIGELPQNCLYIYVTVEQRRMVFINMWL